MKQSTIERLKSIALKISSGEIQSSEANLKIAERAIAIHAILQDEQWHTAREISKEIGVSPDYVRCICRVFRDAGMVKSDRGKGWKFKQLGEH